MYLASSKRRLSESCKNYGREKCEERFTPFHVRQTRGFFLKKKNLQLDAQLEVPTEKAFFFLWELPALLADNVADRAKRRDRDISLENRFHLFIFLFLSSCVFGDGLPIRVVESHE